MITKPDKFALRWVLEYSTGRRKNGMWGMSTKNKEDQAWCQPKKDLVWAVIEGKNLKTMEIVRLVECPVADFRVFQWVATASVNPFAVKGNVKPRSRLMGLKMLTRYKEYQVLGDGVVQSKDISDGLANLNFATY
jgi:hypothetical protein